MGLITEASKPAQSTPSEIPVSPRPAAKPAPVIPPVLTAPALARGEESIAIENECVVYRFSNQIGETITKIIPCSNVDSYLVQTSRHRELLKTAIWLAGTAFLIFFLNSLPGSSIFLTSVRESSGFIPALFFILAIVAFVLWLFVRQVIFQIHASSGSNTISMRVPTAKSIEAFVAEIERRRSHK
jgi:hypothetical protein